MSAAGVVLAGGHSRRMGRPKATLDWHGRPLLRHVVDVLIAGGCEQVVVVAPATGAPWLAEVALPRAAVVASDREPDQGPLHGLAVGLGALAAAGLAEATPVFVAATDLAFLEADVVRAVLAVLSDDPAAPAAVPVIDGRVQPLAAAYRLAALGVVEHLLETGVRRATALAEALTRVVTLDALPAGALANLNTPDDYARAVDGD